MTISNEAIKVTVQGDGVQTLFNYTFLIPNQNTADLYLTDLDSGAVTLLSDASWLLSGGGNPAGGTFTYPRTSGGGVQPLSNRQTLTLVRAVPNTQQTNLGNQNGYYPRAVEAALDWIVMQVQQFVDETGRSLRVPISEQGLAELPAAAFRRNGVQGYDSVGAPIIIPIPSVAGTVIPEGGNTARTLAEWFGEPVDVRGFGAVPDWNGTSGTDNTAAINLAFAYAASRGRMAYVPAGDFYCANAVTLPGAALGLRMDGRIVSQGGFTALTIGEGGAQRQQRKLYGPLRVIRRTQSDWSSESDIGIRLFNLDACLVHIAEASQFTIGVSSYGDQLGCEDSTWFLGRIVDNKVGLDLRTGTATGWNNSNRYIGGHFACSSATNQGVNRYGVRLSREAGAYTLHNHNIFYGPAFELQIVGGHQAIPFRVEVDGRALMARDVRMEACSPFVAEHTGAFNDAYYEVDFVGTYGTFVGILYSGATRAGGTIRVNHQALAAHEMPKLIAANESIRASAFRDAHQASGGIGFDGMGMMSSNPSAGTTLTALVFSGLPLFTLNSNDITIPTSRALGFVLDMDSVASTYGIAKEVFVAAEGTELRPIVTQFDAAENVLIDTSPIYFSNANAVWNGAPNYWWEMNTDLDQLSGGYPLFLWQRITLHPNCRYAFVGVRGGSATARLKALRLFSSPLLSPQVLSGGARDWGTREMQASTTWTVPSLGAGATATIDVTVPGLRGGDFVQAGFDKDSGFQNGGVVFHAVQGGTASTNQVRVTAQNVSAGTINVGSGTLYVRGLRPLI